MFKQLSTGRVVDVSNIENMYDLFNEDQLEIIQAYMDYKEEEKREIIEDLQDVNDILNETEDNIKDLLKYVNRYGLKNENKVLEKIKKIYKYLIHLS